MKKRNILLSTTPYAVSEVLGTVILIIIAVSAGTAITVIILNPWINYYDSTLPFVSLVGSTDGDTVVFEHRGGIALSDETKIRITIAGTDYSIQAQAPYLLDSNGNGKWDVGEQCRYTYAGPLGLANKEVRAVVVDGISNSVILEKTIQEGLIDDSMVIAINPYLLSNGVTETSAIMRMYYNFIFAEYHMNGYVNFSYFPTSLPSNCTWTPQVRPPSLTGWYSVPITGLISGVQYTITARIYYIENGINKTNVSSISFWTYTESRGYWHFDEPAGSSLAVDSSYPQVNGTVSGATFSPSGHVNNSLRLDSVNDKVVMDHHQKFNITDEFTLRTWVNPGTQVDNVPGDITYLDSSDMIDDLGIRCFEPDVIHIANDIYCIACRTELNASLITVEVGSDGLIQTVVDTVYLDIPFFYEPDIIHVTNTIYAIAFGAETTQFNASGYVVTLTIDTTGDISDTVLDILDFNQFFGTKPVILHIANTVYAISYGGGASPALNISTGYLLTISISSSGQIDNSLIDVFKYNGSFCLETDCIHITDDIYAVTYGEDDGLIGYVITVSIDQSGNIDDAVIDDISFVINDEMEPSIAHVVAEKYIVCYGGNVNNDEEQGFLFSIAINSSGSISAIIDNQPIATQFCMSPHIIPISQSIIGVMYSGGFAGSKGKGYVDSYRVYDNGQISDTVLTTYSFINKNGSSTVYSLLHNQNTRFLVLYGTNTNYHGILGTLDIAATETIRNIVAKSGVFSLVKSRYNLTGSLVIGGSIRSVSATLANGWNHIVMTYDGSEIRLYVNTTLVGQLSCSGPITSNSEPLIFGDGIIGRIDEAILLTSAEDVTWITTDYLT